MVEQCGGTVEQWNSDSGAGWWISGTVLVEQWNSGTVMVEQCRWNSDSGTVWWNSKTVFVERCGGTVEQ